jgi:hypothetical protein
MLGKVNVSLNKTNGNRTKSTLDGWEINGNVSPSSVRRKQEATSNLRGPYFQVLWHTGRRRRNFHLHNAPLFHFFILG